MVHNLRSYLRKKDNKRFFVNGLPFNPIEQETYVIFTDISEGKILCVKETKFVTLFTLEIHDT